jgi:hypothetical protein
VAGPVLITSTFRRSSALMSLARQESFGRPL